MKVDKAISICLEPKEIKTLDCAAGIIEDLMNTIEETGNVDITEFYGMWDTFNNIASIVSDFSEKYLIEIKKFVKGLSPFTFLFITRLKNNPSSRRVTNFCQTFNTVNTTHLCQYYRLVNKTTNELRYELQYKLSLGSCELHRFKVLKCI